MMPYRPAMRLKKHWAAGSAVNFVITDWNMPIMDGLTLLRTVRKSAELRQLPALMVTADVRTNTVDAAMQLGADGYVDKQFLNVGDFKHTLNGILIMRGLLSS